MAETQWKLNAKHSTTAISKTPPTTTTHKLIYKVTQMRRRR